jgi:hypothetical protein
VRYDRQHSYAVWSILKPREPVTVDAADESGLNQFCVTVNYVVAGRSPKDGVGCAEGTWTLEIPDHALGRAVERSGLLHPEAIIRDAHRNLLQLPTDVFGIALDTAKSFFLKAGAGAFCCHIRAGRDVSLRGVRDEWGVHVFTPTWIDDAKLFEDQVVLNTKADPGRTLGDCWPMPRPLINIEETTAGRLEVATLAVSAGAA